MKQQSIYKDLLRYFLYILQIFLLLILQDTPKILPNLFGGKPLLLVSAALAVAAQEKPVTALLFGAVCGLLIDSGSGGTGYFSIILTLLCFAESELMQKSLVISLISTMIFSIGAIAVILGLYFVTERLFSGTDGLLTLFMSSYITRAILTYICIIPLYLLNKFMPRKHAGRHLYDRRAK
jgi:rod shape-determining protein MreD